ncbi:MAG: CIA30 family protein [Bacteroidota bacterium]
MMRIMILFTSLSFFSNSIHIDFGNNEGGMDWQVVNDGVMGGLSQGKAILSDSSVIFAGTISLDNYGGFSTLRSPIQATDLSVYRTLKIRYRAEGQDFAIQLQRSTAFYNPYLKFPLPQTKGKWTSLEIPLSTFKEVRMSKPTGVDANAKLLSQTIRLALINDGKKAGPFSLEVDFITFE